MSFNSITGLFFSSFILISTFIYVKPIEIPMISTPITINTNSTKFNNNNNNIRSLIERNMEITNFKYFLMETEICIGTPVQCFKVLYDTGMTYLILGVENSNLKFKNGFNSLLSESFSTLCDKKLLAIPFKSSVSWGKRIKRQSLNFPRL